MFVILVRHGKAESGLSNPERPLTERGRECIEEVGACLSRTAGPIDQIWHSGILRARQTALIIGKHLSPEPAILQIEALSPHGNPENMLNSLNAEKQNIMLVSHLPFLDYLGNLMLTGDRKAEHLHFSPGSAVKLINKNGNWEKDWTVNIRI